MKINDYKKLANDTGHTRFPIVNEDFKLVGIVTSREIINMNEEDELGKIMTRNPLSVLTNTVASCAHMMIWEGIELLPVTNNNKKLLV